MQKTLNFEISHPDPHSHNITAFRMKMSNESAGSYSQIGTDFVFDPATVPVGDPLTSMPVQITFDVPYGPVDYYFMACGINSAGEEGIGSTPPIQVSYDESFVAPTLVLV